ncbi:MAG: hypothetical protein ABEJ31_11125 [Haloarculaceae archaeon]
MTLVTLLYTVDDLLLAVEPLRMGRPEIAVDGILGSLLFFVTANVGLVALVGSVRVGRATLVWHLPALLVLTAISGLLLWRGRLRRWHGLALLALYVAYLVVTITVFSQVPVQG